MKPWVPAAMLACSAFLSSSAASPPRPAEARTVAVGLDEKLGSQVPLGLTLNDEEGKPVLLGSLINKPTILTLNYFSCTGLCTPLLNGVADVLGKIPAKPGQDFQVITVSFDPRDTPDIAAVKRAAYLREIDRPYPPSAWRFLTGPAASTRALCASVGFNFKIQDGNYIHPGAILLLSPQGRVTRYLYGVAFLPADLQMAVNEASRGEARPTINHWLPFCFIADPTGRGYVFSVTRAAASLTLILAFGFLAFLVFRKKGRGVAP